MRQIGHFENESAARTFGNFLYVQGVENLVEAEAGHGWAVWVHAEEELERAAKWLAEFRAEPENPRFRAKAAVAEELRAKAEKERAAYAKRTKTGAQVFRAWHANGFGPVTVVLIVASVVVFILSKAGDAPERVMSLFTTEWAQADNYIRWLPAMPEIRSGEVWRLFTPIFIHFGFMHIIFNMLWLRDLGGAIEWNEGSLKFTLLVVVIAGLSNTAQFLVGGPSFGGMSGVVYGLLGYIWLKGKFDPASGYFLHPQTVVMMAVWYFLCLTGLVGHIANTVHTVGLATGCAWGWLSSLRRK